MSEFEIKPLKLIVVIVNRNKDKKVIKMFNDHGIDYHIAIPAKGTAPTEMLSYFGLGEKEKTVILSIAEQEKIKIIFKLLKEELDINNPDTGVAFQIRISNLSSMLALKYLTRSLDNKEEK
ncbi:MAG: hypothetical protein GX242_03300 [Clostridiales bacterium]|nr:hypothetical protein [Clostridiales bacterium]